MQCNGHCAVQGHSRSPILVPIESSLIIGQIFASERGVPHFNALAGGDHLPISPLMNIALNTKFVGLHFRCRRYLRIFNHFYVIRPESYRIQWNYAVLKAIAPFKVIQGHWQGSHSPGKPGKLLELCQPGKLLEKSWNFIVDLEFLIW